MIHFVLLIMFVVSANAIEHKSDISIKYVNYKDYSNEIILLGNTKLKYKNDIVNTDLTIEYLYSTGYESRKYLTFNELYFTKEYEDYTISLGKTIKYWGELEGFNIADIYNQKNYLLDPFDKSSKLGAIGFSISKYFGENSLELGMKFYEESVKYPSKGDPYYPFSVNYDTELKLSDNKNTTTVHLIYSFVTDESIDSETKVILFHGYDNKRYFTPTNKTTIAQYAYKVNKVLLLSNIIYQGIIFKCETSYTDVINDDNMSDYAQFSFGVENNIYNLPNMDVNLYLEYYNYFYLQDEKIKNVDISEIYDNDIFLAFKFDFKNVESTEIKAGLLHDLSNEEIVFKLNAKSRIKDRFIVTGDLIHTISNEDTVLSNIGDSTRLVVGLTYTF